MIKSEQLLRDAFWARIVQPESAIRDYWVEIQFVDCEQPQVSGWFPLLALIEWSLIIVRVHETRGYELASVTILREDDPNV